LIAMLRWNNQGLALRCPPFGAGDRFACASPLSKAMTAGRLA
jgi:hypothetical protein